MEPTTGSAEGDYPQPLSDPLRSAVIGRYKLLRLIGEGGMGTVYEAEQANPRRTVALKIIKPGMTNAESLRRFEQECEALGRLQHPGIAQIYEAGTADTGFGPQPYFAMELVRGRTPRDYVRHRSLDTRQRLELVAKIADAVHHAHQRGLIHRDLKPSNILVDESGQPKVLDFGVTRVTDDGGQSTRQTDVGQLIGTLAYMSPEQVGGDPLEIDIRTDVYALGVLLYELLGERRPYDVGRKLPEAVRVIQEEDPVPLSTIDRAYRGDIETIATRALEKNKTRRYGSAAELAADIRRYLKDEPIVARPPSVRYQLQKFSRRHRGLVAGVAAVFVVLVLGIVASTWQATRAIRAEMAALLERDRARQAEAQAGVERDRAAAAEQQATTQRDRALMAETQATQDRNRAQEAEQQARLQRDTAVVEKRRADAEATEARKQSLLNIWRLLSRESVRDSSNRLDGDRAALLARQAMLMHGLTPQEPRYLVEDALQRAASLDQWSHALPRAARAVAFSPDRIHMATGSVDSLVRVWDLRNPGVPRYLLKGHRGRVQSVAFSPDGRYLASAGDGVRVWDLRTPNYPSETLIDGTAIVAALAFSPDGMRLAAASDVVRIWELRNVDAAPVSLAAGVAPAGSAPFAPVVRSVAFSADGAYLAAGSDSVRVWNLRDPDRPPVIVLGTAPPATLGKAQINAVAFSTDSSRLAAGGTADSLRIWNLRNLAETPLQFGGSQFGEVTSLAFSDDNSRLAAGSLDGNIRLWDARNPAAAPLLLRGQRAVTSLAFSTDGSNLATADYDTLWLWDLKGAGVPREVLPRLDGETTAVLSADGQRVASVRGRTVRVWNLQTPQASPSTNRNATLGPFIVFSADNRLLASADPKYRIHVWDVNQAEGSQMFEGHEGPIMSLAFSPDGSRLASGSLDRSVRIWNIHDRETAPRVIRFEGPQGFRALAFSPDGSKLAFNSIDRLYVTDLQGADLTPTLFKGIRIGTIPTALAFTPDGSRLATADGVSQTVRLFDVRSPDAPPVLLAGGHRDNVRSVAFSPDGWLLASTSADGTVRVWDLRRPEALPLVLDVPDGPATAAVFSNDGTRLRAMTRTTVLEWPLWTATADYLCTRVWRNLSLNEWRLYIGDSIPYQRTCPALPPGEGAPE